MLSEFTTAESKAIHKAKVILLKHLKAETSIFNSPATVKTFISLHCAGDNSKGREAFSVLYLDSQHRLIDVVKHFTGTLTQTSVYPREIVKQALILNAGAVILVHNHPSGLCEPSRADELLTQTLKSSLSLVDVKVLDHLIAGDISVLSFAEKGLI